jgi:hypothetical protein
MNDFVAPVTTGDDGKFQRLQRLVQKQQSEVKVFNAGNEPEGCGSCKGR